jgi:hypothetical protein
VSKYDDQLKNQRVPNITFIYSHSESDRGNHLRQMFLEIITYDEALTYDIDGSITLWPGLPVVERLVQYGGADSN